VGIVRVARRSARPFSLNRIYIRFSINHDGGSLVTAFGRSGPCIADTVFRKKNGISNAITTTTERAVYPKYLINGAM